MTKKTSASISALALCLGMFSAMSVSAQPAAATSVNHHQMMGDMMKEMIQEMNEMTEQMTRDERTPEQRKQMSQRMERMSKVMHRISGLESRPAMKGPEMQKQYDQMLKQMDEMKRDPSMKSTTTY